MSEDYEQPSQDELRERVAEMQPHYFLGEKLEPFSFNRQAACQRLSLHSGAAPVENAVILIYVCTQDRASLERTRSAAGRQEFFKQMEKWADDNNIGLMTHAGKEVQRVADEIWSELEASEGDPEIKESGKQETRPPN